MELRKPRMVKTRRKRRIPKLVRKTLLMIGPKEKLVFIEDLTSEQLDEEISKGIEDIKNGDVYSSEEVKRILFENDD